jgi:DNA uptake protein ComE-like DNA-binding protein
MNLSTEPIRNWFGFTRRERRSTFILLILIVFIIGSRYLVPGRQISLKDVTGSDLTSKALSELAFVENSPNPGASSDRFSEKSRSASGIYRYKKDITTSSIYRNRDEDSRPNSAKQRRPLLDLNNADSASLVKLPGIGPVLSVRILKYRHLLGGFVRIEQLKEVYGLKEETFEMIKGRVFADSLAVSRININSAGYKELSHIHYFEKYEITAILKYKEIKGRIIGIGDLIENKLISAEKARRVGPYLKFDE